MWIKDYQEKGKLAFIDRRGKSATGRSKIKFMSLEEVEFLRAQNLMLKKSIGEKSGY